MDLASGAAEDYDPPPGDGKESDDATQNAIDNNPSTQWDTERYTDGLQGVNKSGVGIYVDAGSPIAARGMSLTTSTPGFKAAVYAANGSVPEQISGWTKVSARLHGRREGDRPAEHPRQGLPPLPALDHRAAGGQQGGDLTSWHCCADQAR